MIYHPGIIGQYLKGGSLLQSFTKYNVEQDVT